MKPISYAKAAIRVLARMPPPTATRIRGKIADYAVDPLSQINDIKALQGRDAIRLRVGDWRVILEDGVVLAVLAIGQRGGIHD